nr:cobaltochelatase subunit CobN [uncultured Desulfobulbus sp.]
MNRSTPCFLVLLLFFCTLISSARAATTAKVALLEIDMNGYQLQRAIDALELPASIETRFFTLAELNTDPKAESYVRASSVVLVNVMAGDLATYMVDHALMAGRSVYAMNHSSDPEALQKNGFIFDPDIMAYHRHTSQLNLINMIRLVAHRHIDSSVSYAPLQVQPEICLHHPDHPENFTSLAEYQHWYEQRKDFKADNPKVAILLYNNSLKVGLVEAVDDMIRKFEAGGLSVYPCFGSLPKVLASYLKPVDGKPPVDMVLAFTLKFASAINDDIRLALEELNLPLFNVINPYAETVEEWRKNPVGITPFAAAWAVATPEFSGAIEPTVLLGKKKLTDPSNGRELFVGQTVDECIEFLLPRLHNWAKLQRMANKDKKVAILYYNHHQGKQNIAAAYLNVFRSLETITARMKAEGYQIDDADKLTERGIQDMVMASGRNIGSWAPGELDALLASGGVEQVSLAEYTAWFDRLPDDFKKPVIAQWGEPKDCAIMTKDGNLIFPMVKLGNVVLLPEPARGWSDDPLKLYHDTTLYPHHQYIAAYLWLKEKFQADAMIHLGTHSTYEWLPGKQAGLAPSDPPEIMIGDIPNIYPYIVDDVGEGIQAKRRGRAVIIDHLTPPMKEADLYSEYKQIHDLYHQYEIISAKGGETAAEYQKQIFDLVKQTGLDKDIGLEILDDAAMEKIHLYLHEIDDNSLPYGLHTFGKAYSNEATASTLELIQKQNPSADPAQIRKDLVDSPVREMNNLIRALDGEYAPAGEGNDPLRNLAAIPTGKNFYGFSPAKVPSKAAWNVGKQAAEEMIRAKMEKEGKYPEKVGVVLWATETSRNEGVNESTVLALMGVEPVWDPSGRVIDTRIIPGKELGRPRIDVLINPSGLYRDMFPEKLLFLDEAVQKAMAQTDIENFLARNQATIQQALMAKGMSAKEAEEQSRFRIFTEEVGSYGTGIAEMTGASGIWDTDESVSDVYINRVGFAIGQGKWGVKVKDTFKENLRGVDTAVHSRSTNVIGVIDTDDFFQYLGGMSLAVKNVRGEAPDTLVTMHRKKNELFVEDVAKTVGREMRTRYLNPQWIEGMKGDNYAGARQMADFAENLWGWQVTVRDAVSEDKWQQVYEVYVEDKYDMDLAEFFDKNSPWAYQSMTARMLETVRKGYWQPNEAVTKKLAAEYATNVVRRGVACCDHTCNNPMLNQMVVNIISMPGVLDPKIVERFKLAIEQAAQKTLAEQTAERAELIAQLNAVPVGEQQKEQEPEDKQSQEVEEDQQQPKDDAQPSDEGTKAEKVEGYKMEEIKTSDDSTELSSSGIQWAASLFVVFMLALFIWGSRRRR